MIDWHTLGTEKHRTDRPRPCTGRRGQRSYKTATRSGSRAPVALARDICCASKLGEWRLLSRAWLLR